MRRRGFTLVELLVVIAIIALLVGILMPTLARVKQLAQQMVCGTNLSNIGKAMMLYANDYDDEYPLAGGGMAIWDSDGQIDDWCPPSMDIQDAFGRPLAATATITSNFYLLVKYTDMTTKTFVCKGDVDTKAFRFTDGIPQPSNPEKFELEDAWDFGQENTPGLFCSYSMHMPYRQPDRQAGFPISPTARTSSPLCADRNPYLDKNAKIILDDDDLVWPEWKSFAKGTGTVYQYYDVAKKCNSVCHGRQGQNVLYNDCHVEFEKYPNVGIQNDNIWQAWASLPPPLPTPEERQVGRTDYRSTLNQNKVGQEYPKSVEDAFLVNEYND